MKKKAEDLEVMTWQYHWHKKPSIDLLLTASADWTMAYTFQSAQDIRNLIEALEAAAARLDHKEGK